ncbi:MAG: amino acid ABC transporter substrate-binding protein [Alteromonadaceae bacterium]|nr:amino acid ABC transporter substrate-binding protein [Alteromonadaceae bacterium]
MRERMHWRFGLAVCLALLLGLTGSTGVLAAANQPIAVGYVEIDNDPRYQHDNAYTGIEFRTLGRPYAGAELGIEDARMLGNVIGVEFQLVKKTGSSVDELVETLRQWRDDGVSFVLTDLPADTLSQLAAAVSEWPLLLLNISSADDSIRGERCRANIAHVYPSRRMLTDALVQHLVSRKWKDILILKGERPADAQLAKALTASAKKFGANIVEQRAFKLSKNPRDRSQNNIALLTGDADYDVAFVADESGEFDRYVPYQTQLPRPVVGTAGLTPRAWHWSWYRHGAPQLQHRFEALAPPRRMNSETWAAWAAIKAVSQAALRAERKTFPAMSQFMLGHDFNLDVAKGNPSSFRTWNQQLRQPILLATPNAVIARAPLEEFLHEKSRLDTLGEDRLESQCDLN